MRIKEKYKSYSDIIHEFYPNYPYNKEEYNNKIQVPSITFQVTDACNLKCTYCYQINKGKHVMPFQVAKDFIDLLIENNENTQQYLDTRASDAAILDFIGGEPLLEIELIDQILDYFVDATIKADHPWQYNWRGSMSSNGTLYFEPEVQQFFKKWCKKISFNISIDGNKQLHDACRVFPDGTGSYDKAIKAVHHYINTYHQHMGSKMTLAPQNIQYTYEAIMGLIKEGYDDINLNCVFEKGWTEKDATILYYQLKQLADFIIDNDLEEDLYISMFQEKIFKPKDLSDTQNWCGGNGSMIAVDWKGDIYPCLRYMESSLGNIVEPIIIGNIKDGLMTTAKCQACIQQLTSVNRINQSTQECLDCSIADGCAWCQAYNYQDSGTFFHRATYICCMHKARSLANAYFWNSLYHKHHEMKRFKRWLSDEESLKIIPQDELTLLNNLEK